MGRLVTSIVVLWIPLLRCIVLSLITSEPSELKSEILTSALLSIPRLISAVLVLTGLLLTLRKKVSFEGSAESLKEFDLE